MCMFKTRALTGSLTAVFVLTLVSSVRADTVHADKFLELFSSESRNLTVLEDQSARIENLFNGQVENNSGKFLGFSVASITRGPRLGIVKPQSPSVSQNPEPTAMVLLGTGLAAAAAFARKRSRRGRL